MSKKKVNAAVVGIWLDLETKAEVERIAAKIGITPSSLAKNLVVVGLGEVQTMERLGVLQGAVMLQELRDRIKKRLDNESERFQGVLSST